MSQSAVIQPAVSQLVIILSEPKMLRLVSRGKDLVKTREQGQAGAAQRPWLNKSLVAVKEQGMLFHFNPSDIEVDTLTESDAVFKVTQDTFHRMWHRLPSALG